MLSEGLITLEDIEGAKTSRVISIGLPAYCFLQMLLRSAKANAVGLLLGSAATSYICSLKLNYFLSFFFFIICNSLDG